VEPAAPAAGENPPEWGSASGRLTLLPAEERAPTAPGRPVTASEDTGYSYSAQPAAAKPLTNTSPADFSPFQAPLISRLEPDKWYVQVGVYTRADNVEDEINRIGMAYPLAIQNVGTDTNPMFRVLLGPMNQGESGAMLQRFKSIGYTDAFVRHN
jgi:cell division septation protein DedD